MSREDVPTDDNGDPGPPPDIEPGWDMGWFLWPVALWLKIKTRVNRLLGRDN